MPCLSFPSQVGGVYGSCRSKGEEMVLLLKFLTLLMKLKIGWKHGPYLEMLESQTFDSASTMTRRKDISTLYPNYTHM